MTGLRYVYAICRPFPAALSAELTGVAGAPARQVLHEDLVAVVGTVPEEDFAVEPLRGHLRDPEWVGETALAHECVVDALTTVTSPLPLRLATVLRDDAAVRLMMQEGHDRFVRALDRIEGRVEWRVRIYAETGRPAAFDGAGPDRAGISGAAAEGRVPANAEEYARQLHDDLSRRAEGACLHPPRNVELSGKSGTNVLDAAYLVPRMKSEEFVERVRRAQHEETGLRVEFTGPWAAYAFTGESAFAGELAWPACDTTVHHV
ncbi:gas vesicle protein [Streptomyces sp. Tue6028]|uniref:GvpL/GvpF family gas vesicle protein n=1 Tax=Streptomyces sp. Tue6028 TaxID=2036037 RepID=UPI000BB3688C|nr:GvpL/GvpF family gas vesicle protein [Streptomyces sp. Tue6028]PBC60331.1 gas vesicle protein [Streptomyces sp. Tue6028]